jgi:hypothetical protein
VPALSFRKPFEAMTEFLDGSVPVPPEIFQGVLLLSQETIDTMSPEERAVLEGFCVQYEAKYRADALLGPDEFAFRGAE